MNNADILNALGDLILKTVQENAPAGDVAKLVSCYTQLLSVDAENGPHELKVMFSDDALDYSS